MNVEDLSPSRYSQSVSQSGPKVYDIHGDQMDLRARPVVVHSCTWRESSLDWSDTRPALCARHRLTCPPRPARDATTHQYTHKQRTLNNTL